MWPNPRIFQKLEIKFLGEISQLLSLGLLKRIFCQNTLCQLRPDKTSVDWTWGTDLWLLRGRGPGGGTHWEFGISRCELLYIHWINNKVLLCSTGNYIQYPVVNHNRKEYQKEYMYVQIYTYIYINESLFCTPETNTALYIN